MAHGVARHLAKLLAQQDKLVMEQMEAAMRQSQRWAVDAVSQAVKQVEAIQKAAKQNK